MIRAAQIQDVSDLVAVLHASIRSCIQDHQRNEAKIQAWLETKNYENILMLLHYNNCWVYVLQHVVVGFIMMSDRGQILQHAIAPEVQQRGIGRPCYLKLLLIYGLKMYRKSVCLAHRLR